MIADDEARKLMLKVGIRDVDSGEEGWYIKFAQGTLHLWSDENDITHVDKVEA